MRSRAHHPGIILPFFRVPGRHGAPSWQHPINWWYFPVWAQLHCFHFWCCCIDACLKLLTFRQTWLMIPTRGGGSHDFLKTHLVISYEHVFPSNQFSISLRPGAHAKSRTWHNIWVFILVSSCVRRVPAHAMCFLHLSSSCHPTLGAPMFPVGAIFQASCCPTHSYQPSSCHHPGQLSCKYPGQVISQSCVFSGRAHALYIILGTRMIIWMFI